MKKNFSIVRVTALARAARRGGGASVSGGLQTLPRRDPAQHAVGDPAWVGVGLGGPQRSLPTSAAL